MERSVLLANQPPNMSIQLEDHQRCLIYQMELLEKSEQIETKNGSFIHTRIGINSEPNEKNPIHSMVGLLARDKKYWPEDERYIDTRINSYASGLYWTNTILQYDRLPCSLILASSNTIKEWIETLKKTDLKVIVLTKLVNIEHIKITDYNVIIITPNMYNTLINLYSKFAWKRLIISDPCNMSISNMAKCSAGHYWLVTSTPTFLVSRKHNNTNKLIKDIIGSDIDIENKYEGLILQSKNFI